MHLFNKNRVGDLSLGDFIGYSDHDNNFKNNCVTAVLINNNKGKKIFKVLENDFYLKERNYEECIAGGISLREPSSKSRYRDKFLKNYVNKGFSKSVRQALWLTLMWSFIKKSWLFLLKKMKG